MALNAKEILARLRSRRPRIEPVKLPLDDGEELTLGLIVLSPHEHQEAVLATARHFKAADIEPGRPLMVDAWNNELATQVLARAIVEPESSSAATPKRVFRSSEDLRRSLRSLDEMSHLIEGYYAHPDYELRGAITDERLHELADEVRRSPLTLNSLDTATLRRLVRSLVAQRSN